MKAATVTLIQLTKNSQIYFTKSQKLSYHMSQFCQSNNADDKSKTKIATKNNRLKQV